jgi:oxygen-independent coproporphyrinogen-3 oxidase
MAGFDVREMEADFGVRLRYYCMQQAKKSLHSGLLLYENFRLRLSDKALFVSDSVLSDLIWA